MSDLRYPIKLNDDYTCQGTDAEGTELTFSALLHEGSEVGSWHPDDENGEPMYVSGKVVRRDDGLWIEALSAGSDGEDRPANPEPETDT